MIPSLSLCLNNFQKDSQLPLSAKNPLRSLVVHLKLHNFTYTLCIYLLSELQLLKKIGAPINRGHFFQSSKYFICLLVPKTYMKILDSFNRWKPVLQRLRELSLVMQRDVERTQLKTKSENSIFKFFLADTSLLGASYYLTV